MSIRKCELILEKECKHSVRYKAVSTSGTRPVESIYVLRTALPEGKPPQLITMTLEIK